MLLEFPPLAELCNAIISSLNEIRLCAPTSIGSKVITRIEEILVKAAQILNEREKRFGKSSIDTEKSTFQQLVLVFHQTFLSYIDRCVKRVFPSSPVLNFERINKELPMQEMIAKVANENNHPSEEVSYVIDRVSVISM